MSRTPTKYTAPFVISKTQTIKAIASGHAQSAVASGAYTLVNSLDVIIATSTGNNVVEVPINGAAAFAVAVKDTFTKADPNMAVTTSTTPASLPADITICQTYPSSGAFLTAPSHSVSITTLAAGANKTFAVFVQDLGAIADSPGQNRIIVVFKNQFGGVQDSASVAVYTTK
jgi:hypothetical protein